MAVIILITYSAIALLLFLLAWILLRKDRLSLGEVMNLGLWLCLWPLLFPLFVWTWVKRLSLLRHRSRLRRQKV